MFKQDWMERQIEAVANTLAAILFGKDKLRELIAKREEEEQNENLDTKIEEEMLRHMIKKLVSEEKYLEAENVVKDLVVKNASLENLEIALKFYNELNSIGAFSEEHIEQGIKEISVLY